MSSPDIATARARNAAFSPPSPPVAIFVGGTSGIGQAIAQAFAQHTKGNAHIIICGRNRAAAESIIASFPKPEGGPPHEFVECDATLMRNVQATTQELLSRLPKLNFLVMSQGFLSMRGRDETVEGIDKKLAVHYYSRWKFTHDLIPLLRKAKDAGEDAKVMSVLAAGAGGKIDLDDLGLKKHYGMFNAAMAAPTYNDLMVEEFAAQHPDLSFTHIYPGTVRTPLLSASHWAWRPFMPVLNVLLYPVSVSANVCGEFMLHALLGVKDGAHRLGSKGQDIGRTRYFSTDEARERLWTHTVEAATARPSPSA